MKCSLNEAKQTITDLENLIESLRSDYKAAIDRVHDLEQKQKAMEFALKTSQENVDNLRHELQAIQEQNRPALPIAPGW